MIVIDPCESFNACTYYPYVQRWCQSNPNGEDHFIENCDSQLENTGIYYELQYETRLTQHESSL